MKQIPAWAKELTENVIKTHSSKSIPKITWKKRTSRSSSGTAYYNRKLGIVIRAGRSKEDQKLVLLHELAHWLCPKRAGHNMRFWRTAWTLYKEYGISMTYAFSREKDYKKKAVLAYNEMKGE